MGLVVVGLLSLLWRPGQRGGPCRGACAAVAGRQCSAPPQRPLAPLAAPAAPRRPTSPPAASGWPPRSRRPPPWRARWRRRCRRWPTSSWSCSAARRRSRTCRWVGVLGRAGAWLWGWGPRRWECRRAQGVGYAAACPSSASRCLTACLPACPPHPHPPNPNHPPTHPCSLTWARRTSRSAWPQLRRRPGRTAARPRSPLPTRRCALARPASPAFSPASSSASASWQAPAARPQPPAAGAGARGLPLNPSPACLPQVLTNYKEHIGELDHCPMCTRCWGAQQEQERAVANLRDQLDVGVLEEGCWRRGAGGCCRRGLGRAGLGGAGCSGPHHLAAPRHPTCSALVPAHPPHTSPRPRPPHTTHTTPPPPLPPHTPGAARAHAQD
jgi:hypothetical protein